jgi:hypothetical protein
MSCDLFFPLTINVFDRRPTNGGKNNETKEEDGTPAAGTFCLANWQDWNQLDYHATIAFACQMVHFSSFNLSASKISSSPISSKKKKISASPDPAWQELLVHSWSHPGASQSHVKLIRLRLQPPIPMKMIGNKKIIISLLDFLIKSVTET